MRNVEYIVKHKEGPEDLFSKTKINNGDGKIQEVWKKNGHRISDIKFGKYVSLYAAHQIDLFYRKGKPEKKIIEKAFEEGDEEKDEPLKGALFFILQNNKHLFFRAYKKNETTESS